MALRGLMYYAQVAGLFKPRTTSSLRGGLKSPPVGIKSPDPPFITVEKGARGIEFQRHNVRLLKRPLRYINWKFRH